MIAMWKQTAIMVVSAIVLLPFCVSVVGIAGPWALETMVDGCGDSASALARCIETPPEWYPMTVLMTVVGLTLGGAVWLTRLIDRKRRGAGAGP